MLNVWVNRNPTGFETFDMKGIEELEEQLKGIDTFKKRLILITEPHFWAMLLKIVRIATTIRCTSTGSSDNTLAT